LLLGEARDRANMPHSGQDPPSDAGLESLLEIERRLEARVRAAEVSATERIAAAREATRRLDGELREAIEAEARDEEEATLRAHEDALRRVAAESEARIAVLAAVPEATVERLARRVLGAVIAGGGT